MLTLQAKGAAIWADEHHWTKTPPPNVISPIFFAIFTSLWFSTHDSVDCWSTARPSAARDSFKRVHDWCKAVWPPPPQQISRLRRWWLLMINTIYTDDWNDMLLIYIYLTWDNQTFGFWAKFAWAFPFFPWYITVFCLGRFCRARCPAPFWWCPTLF